MGKTSMSGMQVPLIDLRAQYVSIQDEIDAAVSRVLAKGNYVMGDEVEAFEQEWAKLCKAEYCVAVSSCTDALYLTLMAVGPRHTVKTTPMTFFATIQAIIHSGGKPKFLDIDRTGNIPNVDFGNSLALPVHLYGYPGNWSGKYVIEDAAQAHGLPLRGLAACHSFYPTKNLGAVGQAGAVVTNSIALADEIRLMRTYGEKGRFVHERTTGNFRMDELQAAILRAKLPHLPSWNKKRRQIAKMYTNFLDSTMIVHHDTMANGTSIQTPLSMVVKPPLDHPLHNYHIYAVRVRERDSMAKFLAANGIQTAVRYPVPMHMQPALAHLGYTQGDLPNAEEWASERLSLPIYAEMPMDHVEYVCQKIKEWAEKR